MNSNVHVDNIKNEEVIPYRILLLHGHVERNKCSEHEKAVFISWNKNPEEASVIKNNTFRAIFHLDDGDNTFTVRFNDCSKNISVRFEPPFVQLPYTVQPVYIICKGHDGRFQAPPDVDNSIESAAARILTGAKLIQSVLGELLHVSSFGRKTFYLLESVEVFHSALSWTKALEMHEMELWECFAREIMSSKIGHSSRKYLAFLSHTKFRSDMYKEEFMKSNKNLIQITDGYVALGGGGLALFGSASLFTWPHTFNDILKCFSNDATIDRQFFLDHSFGRNTMSSNFSTTLGAVIHELLHTFELAHNAVGIMGTDYHQVKELFCNTSNIKMGITNYPFTSLGIVTNSSENNTAQIAVSNISLTESSIIILAYSKWLNCSSRIDEKYNLSYDSSNNFVKSSLGIRAIELRSLKESNVLKSWIFPSKVLKFFHMICFDGIKNNNVNIVILFVIDNKGNFIKIEINIQ